MLKNMKVGTKLIAVLVAPVLVLVILASIGVSQRLDTASERPAGRAAGRDGGDRRQPGPRAAERGRLLGRLHGQRRHEVGRRAGGQQRQDRRRPTPAYNAAVDRIDPAKDSDDLKKAVAAVDDRLKNLDTQRRSVDGIETETSKTIEQYVGSRASPSTLSEPQHRHRPGHRRPGAVPWPHHLRQPQPAQDSPGQRGRARSSAVHRRSATSPRPGRPRPAPARPARTSPASATMYSKLTGGRLRRRAAGRRSSTTRPTPPRSSSP